MQSRRLMMCTAAIHRLFSRLLTQQKGMTLNFAAESPRVIWCTSAKSCFSGCRSGRLSLENRSQRPAISLLWSNCRPCPVA